MRNIVIAFKQIFKRLATPFHYKGVKDYDQITQVQNSMDSNGKMRYNLCLMFYLLFDLIFVKEVSSTS